MGSVFGVSEEMNKWYQAIYASHKDRLHDVELIFSHNIVQYHINIMKVSKECAPLLLFLPIYAEKVKYLASLMCSLME